MELALRALMPDDAGSARAFVSGQFAATRYEARALEVLDAALRFDDPEYMALLALGEADDGIAGMVLFGAMAGARAVVKVHTLAASNPAPAVALLDAVRSACEHSGERLIVCELPDDVPFVVASIALESAGYAPEGRVADFVADGIALKLMVRRL